MNAMALQMIVYSNTFTTVFWVIVALALGGAFSYGMLTLVRLNLLLKRELNK